MNRIYIIKWFLLSFSGGYETSADICCHLMKCLYHGLLSPPIFGFEFNFMSHLKRFYNEKENPFFSAFRVFRSRLFCAGAGTCRYQ